MNQMSAVEKYSQAEVISCWQNLSKQGLQKCEQEMVTRYFPATGHLLDVGCGAGRAVLALTEAGYQVSGIDLSLPMLRAGRKLSTAARFSTANLLSLPFNAGAFEAVFMFFGALQHIPGRANRRLALAELGRVVPAGGRLILGLDNLAPALSCYLYWLAEKLGRSNGSASLTQPGQPSAADTTLWSRETRHVHPLVWHARGLVRSLRWRTWPGLVDWARQFKPNGAEPGDTRVAQFSLQTTPGLIYYHLYRADELIEDAASGGWRLLGHHCGTELNENRIYPPAVRQQDKQQFFAFEK